MTPRFSQDDHADRCLIDTVALCKRPTSHLLTVIQCADSPHIVFAKFSVVMLFPWLWHRLLTAFLRHVSVVVCQGAEEEVVGTDTGGGIAVMADTQARGDRTIRQFIGHAMGEHHGIADPEATMTEVQAVMGTAALGAASRGDRVGIRRPVGIAGSQAGAAVCVGGRLRLRLSPLSLRPGLAGGSSCR